MKTKTYLNFAALCIAVIFLFSGCASIVSKGIYPLSINSSPSAKVSVIDKKGVEVFTGNTPTSVKLKAGAGFFGKAEYQVKLSCPGYEDKVVPVYFKLDGWYFGNILFGGLIGMLIVDPATGAMWKIDNANIDETLTPSATSMGTPELKILDINQIPQAWKEHLVKLN